MKIAVAWGLALACLLFLIAGDVALAEGKGISSWDELEQAIETARPGELISIARDLEANREITIRTDVNLLGQGHALRPAKGYCGRAFLVEKASVSFGGLQLEGFECPGTQGAGGAILSMDSVLSLGNCTFTKNRSGHSGGAVYQVNGKLTAKNCVFFQ